MAHLRELKSCSAGRRPVRQSSVKPEEPFGGLPDRGGAAPAQLTDPSLYINRELGLLAFQRRVLEEAQDLKNPLLERVKFISILSSNIDEFFMVRVANLWQQLETRTTEISIDGRSPLVRSSRLGSRLLGS